MNPAVGVRNPAEVYDEFFVPALFAQWGPVVADAALVKPGACVLDIACGTGALTLAVVDRVGPSGFVVGLDANLEMLAVARRKPARVDWIAGTAEALPLADETFDSTVSQFGLMFFQSKVTALREMMRVLRTGGRLAVAVCDAIENSPGYSVFAALLDRLFGEGIGNAFRAPFGLGHAARLREISRGAGILNASVAKRHGKVCFKSIGAMVATERACVWTLGGLLDDDQFARLLKESENELRPFVTNKGFILFDMPVLILTARKST